MKKHRFGVKTILYGLQLAACLWMTAEARYKEGSTNLPRIKIIRMANILPYEVKKPPVKFR